MGTVDFAGVSKTFGGKTVVRALADVDLRVADGEFVALLGPSGCGKSTLLNILAGFERLTTGRVRFDGQTISRPGPDRGVVFQEASLLPWLTVWDNVVFGPQVQGVARSIYEPKAQEILEIVGLEGFKRASRSD